MNLPNKSRVIPSWTNEPWMAVAWDYFISGVSSDDVWEKLYKEHRVYGIKYKQVREIYEKFEEFVDVRQEIEQGLADSEAGRVISLEKVREKYGLPNENETSKK